MTETEKINYLKIENKISMIEALKIMDDKKVKLLLVFEDQRFISVLSIGDIQRAIIKNIPFIASVKEILREDITVSYVGESLDEIKAKMLNFRTECMPILNKEGVLVNVYLWDEVFENKYKNSTQKLDLPVVIMAGGKGARLLPLTNIFPKPLIPIGEKTIIEAIMDKFVFSGCNKFYISINHKAELLKYYFDSLDNLDYNIEYIREKKPLGTAGSLHMLKDKIKSTFFLSNCDIIVDQNIAEIYEYHKEYGNDLTLVAAIMHYKIPYGTMETGHNGELLKMTEKPDFVFKINSGLYIIEPSILNYLPNNQFIDMNDCIEILKKNGKKIGVFPVSENSWTDIGNWQKYNKIVCDMN